MAYRVSNGAGTSFNTATNWDEGVNTPTVHVSTSITVPTAGTNIFSATFTAPNTTNACTGVLVPIAAVGSAGTITATLQEATVDVAGANVTLNITDLRANTLVFFEFTTPYVFTATTANRYRIRINSSGASGVTLLAADSGGANFAYLATMDSNVVPTTGDDVIIVSPNQGASLVMDLDVDASFGSGTNTSAPAFRSWGNALTTANGGVISWPTSTDRTLTIKGTYLPEPGGEFRMGTTANPIQVGTQARLAFDQNGVTCNYGIVHINGAKFSIQGEALTYNKSLIVSGAGTAASPLVLTDTTGWTVGMELVIPPSSDSATNYDETEVKRIRTISGTELTLSDTVGGAESGLTYNHDGAPAFNVTRPCLIDTTDPTKAWYADFKETGDIANLDFDGFRFETTGSGVAGRTALTFSNLATELCTLDDGVFYRILGTNAIQLGNNNDVRTFTWLIAYDCNATGNMGALWLNSLRNKRFENCYCIDSQSAGFFLSTASSCDFVDCDAWACGRASTAAQGGWQATNASNMQLENCGSNCNRSYGITLATMPGLTAINCNFGGKGTNGTADIQITSDSYDVALFDNCIFGSSTFVNNYANASDGTEIKFNKYNQTANDHRWYQKYGVARSTGASLADTTVRTADSLALRIAPEDATTGFRWQYKILARANKAVSALGFIKKNAAFSTDDVVVELFLPGLTPGVDAASDTVTMPDTASWEVFNLAASYTGSVDLYAIVQITAKTTTANAYIYVDDLYNGTNAITGLDVWDSGKPSEIMFEQLGDSAAVWAVATSTLTTAGTAGKKLVDGMTTGEFIALND